MATVSSGASARAPVLALLSLCVISISFAATAPVQIFGTPPTEAPIGQRYLFRPTAVVQGAGAAQFAIENLPRWATFDVQWGRLEGLPTAADIGTYGNIRVAAVRGTQRAQLPAFSIVVTSGGKTGSVSLQWWPPTQNENGSALTDLAGYRIYSGTSATNLRLLTDVRNAGLTRYVIDSIESGPRFFAVTAVNAAGAESEFSSVVRTLVS